MHADEAFRPGHRCGQLADGNRRGVAGDQRIRADHAAEVGEQPELQLLVLGGRLDDQVDVGQYLPVGGCGQHFQGIQACLGAEQVLLRHPLQAAANGLPAALQGVLGNIQHEHLQPGHRAHLRDAVAHGARADHSNLVDLHSLSPLFKRVRRSRRCPGRHRCTWSSAHSGHGCAAARGWPWWR
ncbi:hypothetical protein D9M72_523310 [compost metagenome]